MRIVINLPPVTKKNSQQILVNKATGRPFIMPSAKAREFEKRCALYMPKLKEPINEPVNVRCEYFMPTRRRVDLVNLEEMTLDVLVKYGVLADDNSNIVVSMDGSRVGYSKENARTEIFIERLTDVQNNTRL